MEKCWFIDGYNLLHTAQRLKKTAGDRQSLFSRIADYASTHSLKIVMVLDGKGPQEELAKWKAPFFEVVYSQEVPADAYIEKNLVQSPRGSTAVVTSDRAIQNIAIGAGGRYMDSAQFCKELERSQKDLSDVLFKKRFESHGFHRPFEEKF